MKILKRVLSLLLTTTMLSGVLSSLCLAKETEKEEYTSGTGYVAIGDSITRGYQATENWETEGCRLDNVPVINNAIEEQSVKDNILNGSIDTLSALKELNEEYYNAELKNTRSSYFGRNVVGSYPYLIAQDLGCNTPDNMMTNTATYWSISQDSLLTDMILKLLGIDDGLYDDAFMYGDSFMLNRYKALLYYFGSENSISAETTSEGPVGTYGNTGVVMEFGELLENAGLISINLGMGEIFNRARQIAQKKYDLSSGDTEVLLSAVGELIKQMNIGYSNWLDNYKLLLDYLSAHTDATIVLVGFLNPIGNMTLTDEMVLPVGSAMSAITAAANQQLKEWAEKYGYIYVDISNVETGTVENNMDLVSFLSAKNKVQGYSTHPTAEGYRQISRLILSAISTENTVGSKYDITVDLGRFTTVDYVLVNSEICLNYTLEDHVLTVHYGTDDATRMTVGVLEEGELKLSTYQLSYNEGYTAYRVYTTNSLGTVISKVVSRIKSLLTSVLSKLKITG